MVDQVDQVFMSSSPVAVESGELADGWCGCFHRLPVAAGEPGKDFHRIGRSSPGKARTVWGYAGSAAWFRASAAARGVSPDAGAPASGDT